MAFCVWDTYWKYSNNAGSVAFSVSILNGYRPRLLLPSNHSLTAEF